MQDKTNYKINYNKSIKDKEKKILEYYKRKSNLEANKNQLPSIAKQRLSRAQAHFSLTPEITFTEDKDRQHTCLFLVASDRPGLLAQISQIFLKENIHLHNAKITTAGERVEDMFYITNQNGAVLSLPEQERLTEKLMKNSHF